MMQAAVLTAQNMHFAVAADSKLCRAGLRPLLIGYLQVKK